jgi:hypothetical protein
MNDRYIKIVLTVIAVALCGDLAERLIKPAYAAPAMTHVAICDPSHPNACAGIYSKDIPGFDPAKGIVTETRTGIGVFQQ